MPEDAGHASAEKQVDVQTLDGGQKDSSSGEALSSGREANAFLPGRGQVTGRSPMDRTASSQNLLQIQRLAGNSVARRLVQRQVSLDHKKSALPAVASQEGFVQEPPQQQRPTAPIMQVQTSPAPRVVQRYQAGDEGHGGIEQRALTSIGFTDQEASQIYFGNFLRDFSQLNSNGSPTAHNDFLSLFTVIEVLGWGEYNRQIKPDELGVYVPSEHLDNPAAAGLNPDVDPSKRTVEDPDVQACSKYPAGDPRRKPFDDAFARLSPAQQDAYNSEEARRGQITAAAKASGLPEYIERGKMHAKDKLTAAIKGSRTPESMALMGDALHAVEDYFSHSNMVDVGVWILKNAGFAPAEPYAKKMVEHMHGTNPALVAGTDAKGNPNIVTGTYSPGANDWVSRLELLKAQLHSGEFAKAFLIGLIRMGTVKLEDVLSALGGGVGSFLGGGAGLLLGGVGGGVMGGIQGAGSGAVSGARSGSSVGEHLGHALGDWAGSGVGNALGAVGGFLGGGVGGLGGMVGGGMSGAFHGAVSGAQSGAAMGSDLGQQAGSAVGSGIAEGVGKLVLGATELAILLAAPAIKVAMAPLLSIVDVVIDHFSDQQTTQSGVQAAARGLTGPTHSQIAKDAPDHPLFGVSSRLAEEADKEIGKAMQAAWAARPATPPGGTPAPVTEAEANPVTSLVDKYVSNPSTNTWWEVALKDALSKKL